MSTSGSRKRSRQQDDHSQTTKKRKTAPPTKYGDQPKAVIDVFVCGEGESGELGLGVSKRDGKSPVGVRTPRLNDLANAFDIVQIAAGGMHCAALTRDSRIVTWGVNDDGALGRNTHKPDAQVDGKPDDSGSDDDDLDLNPLECTPAAVPHPSFGEDVPVLVQVVASDCATFVLTARGTVHGWGTFRSKNGRYGFSEQERAKGIKTQTTPMLIPGLKRIKSIAAGTNHVLALDVSGRVFSWGINENGELGRKTYSARRVATTTASTLTPAAVFLPGIRVVSVACGHNHSFAIDDRGHVYGWGVNNYRQLGIPPSADNLTEVPLPTRVAALERFGITAIAGGFHHSLACCADGRVLAWGRCHDSQMGFPLQDVSPDLLVNDSRGRPEILTTPTVVPGISATQVSAGIDNSLAITADGRVHAWGYSQNYRTGLRTEDSVPTPTLVTNQALAGRKIVAAECGGQFLVLAVERPHTNGVA